MKVLRLSLPLVGWCLLIFVLMWLPVGGTPLHPFYSATILIHAGLFLVLGYLVHQVGNQTLNSVSLVALGLGAIFVSLVGVTAEMGQVYRSTRAFSGTDVGINIGYGLLGMLLNDPRPVRWPDHRLVTGAILLVLGFTAGLFGPDLIRLPAASLGVILRSAGLIMILLAGLLTAWNRSGAGPFEWLCLLIAAGLLFVSNPLPMFVLVSLVLLVTVLRIPRSGTLVHQLPTETLLATTLAFTVLWALHSVQPDNLLAGDPTGVVLLAVPTTGLFFGHHRNDE